MKILRQTLKITDYQAIQVPDDSEILSVANSRTRSDREIDIWYLTADETMQYPQTCGIYIIGTGNPLPLNLAIVVIGKRQFLGTIVMPSDLVWHVFRGPLQ